MNYIDLDNICRSCAFDHDLQPIEDNFVIDLFQKLIDINFSKNDELPQKICETCIQTIYHIQKFVLQCKTIDLTLKKYLSNFKNKSNTSPKNVNSERNSLSIVDKIVNNDTLKITNIQTTVQNNNDKTIDSPSETEKLINGESNIQPEKDEINNETISNTAKNKIIENESSLEAEKSNVESAVVSNELNIKIEINEITSNESDFEIEINEITSNEPNVVNEINNNYANVEIETDELFNNESNVEIEIISAEPNVQPGENLQISDTFSINTENKISKDLQNFVDLEKVLLDLQNQFPFDANIDLLNTELDIVSLKGDDFFDDTSEQTHGIHIPDTHLLKFDDNVVIIDAISPN